MNPREDRDVAQGRPGISTTGRRAGTFCLLLIVALAAQATRIQVFEADSLDHNTANQRLAVQRYDQPRGNILVGGRPVTGSTATGGRYDWKRTYTDGPRWAAVTGYSSQTYGNSQLEGIYDDLLSGTDDRLSGWAVWDALSRRQNPGGDVDTTLDTDAQAAALQGLGGQKGAVVAIEPATGRILALASTPPTTRAASPAPPPPTAPPGTGCTPTPTSRCSTGRCARSTRPAPPSRWSPPPPRWPAASSPTRTHPSAPPPRTSCRGPPPNWSTTPPPATAPGSPSPRRW
ncbi:hypothetical protein GCM10025734_50390 [Kitasatospora paranensis]